MRLWLCSLILIPVFVATTQAQLLHDLIHAEVELNQFFSTFSGKTTTVQAVSQDLVTEFTGIAVQGLTASDSLSGDVRFFEHEVWGEWQPLYIVRSATDEAFLAGFRGDRVIKAIRFEIRFNVQPFSEVQIVSAGTFDQRLDDEGEDGIGQSSQKIGKSNDFVIQPPHIHRRKEWGAQPFRGNPIPLNRPSYDYMTLHHTAGFAAITLTEGLEQVRRIQDFHQNGRGWSDIGYQFLMDQEGRLYQGRPFLNKADPFDQGPRLVQGAHVGGANTGNIGVSLMGCYHPPAGTGCRDEMDLFAIDSLIVTFGFLSERYKVSPDQMKGHRDFNNTSCPGDNNYLMLPDFMTEVEDLLLRGNDVLGEGTLITRLDQSGTVRVKWAFLADYGIDSYVIQRREEDGNMIEIAGGKGAEDGIIADSPGVGKHTYMLFAKSDRGTQQRLAVDEISIEPSISSVLAQSFPNPASSEATVRYFIQGSGGIVSVGLFDLTGRLILTSESQHRESGEWYVTTLDTSTLSSGIYLYRILVDGFSSTVFKESKPLIVLR